MRITSSMTGLTLFLALIITSRADSDESDESDESGEHNTKFFDRITSLLDRTTKQQGHHQDGPSTVMQPYPYPYMGYPYYIGTNTVPYLPADYQRIPTQGHPSYPIYPNYPAYPRAPAYNPYPSMPAQAYSSDNKHRNRHSSQEDSEERDYSRGHHDSGNGLSSMDHLLKSNTEYQETGHYIGPYQGRALGLDNKPVSSRAPN